MQLTLEIDDIHARRASRRIGPRLQPFLEGVQQFTEIVDAFISLGPSIAETIWAAIKVSLLLSPFSRTTTIAQQVRQGGAKLFTGARVRI